MTFAAARLAVAVSCVAAVSACGGNPASPTQSTSGTTSGGSGASCRTFLASATVTVRSSAGISTSSPAACSWDDTLHQFKCTIGVSSGAAVCTTTVSTFNSTADFIDEIQVIPPRLLRTSDVETASGAAGCGAGAIQNITYVYDAQRRVTQILNGSATTLFTAWDSAGRPARGTTSSGAPVIIVYDSSGRTETQTTGQGAAAAVVTTTFDANGTPIKVVAQDRGLTTTTTTDVKSTARICK